MMHVNSPGFQVITSLPDPLALFFRPGIKDHTTLHQVISEGRLGFSGAIFDPSHMHFQKELLSELTERGLRRILDPVMLELSTPGGLTPTRQKLKWADNTPHQQTDFTGKKVDRSAGLIAECVTENNFDGVLAPTHFLAQGANDPWLLVDRRLTSRLRQELTSSGGKNLSIFYPLAVPTSVFFDPNQRRILKASLETLEIDGIWLRVSPFGANSGGPSLQNYIIACRDLHSLKIPIVAEKTGTQSLALLAFGAVTGIDTGISSGDQYDFTRLNRVKETKRKPFSPPARVYLQSLEIFVSLADAKKLFEDPKFRPYACLDSECCQNGFKSTLADPRRHFANSRMEEVAQVSATPAILRPSGYLQQMLRPADDQLERAVTNLHEEQEPLRKVLVKQKRRMHGRRKTLTAMHSSHPMQCACPPFPQKAANLQVSA